jgi:hypothetical protein
VIRGYEQTTSRAISNMADTQDYRQNEEEEEEEEVDDSVRHYV